MNRTGNFFLALYTLIVFSCAGIAVASGAFTSTAVTTADFLTKGPFIVASDLAGTNPTTTVSGVGVFTQDANGHFSGAGYGDYPFGVPANTDDAGLNDLLQTQRYKPTMNASIPVTPGTSYRMEMIFHEPNGADAFRTMAIQAEGDSIDYRIGSHGTDSSKLAYDFVAGDSALDLSLAFTSDNATLSGFTLRNTTANPLSHGTFSSHAINSTADLQTGPFVVASDLGNVSSDTTIAGVGTFTANANGYVPGNNDNGGAPVSLGNAGLNSLLQSQRLAPGLNSLSIPVIVGRDYQLELIFFEAGGLASDRAINVFAEGDQTTYSIVSHGTTSSVLDYAFTATDPFLNFRLEFLSDNATISGFSLKEIIDSFILGDMNGDGVLNNFDISPFELALADPAAYEAAFPALVADYHLRGDINADTAFNNFDISPFEQLLVAPPELNATAVPEPSSCALLALGALGLLCRRQGRNV